LQVRMIRACIVLANECYNLPSYFSSHQQAPRQNSLNQPHSLVIKKQAFKFLLYLCLLTKNNYQNSYFARSNAVSASLSENLNV